MKYKLTGTMHKAGSEGRSQPFEQTLYAESPKQAMETGRQQLFEAGNERILYKSVAVKAPRSRGWRDIPMMQALGLE